jgi:CRP-like cAMP-binding protein
LFRSLPDAQRSELIARTRIRPFEQGDTIVSMGAEGDCLMVVLSGRVRISVVSPDGREMVLAILEAGEVFGEIAVLDGKERTADAIAHTHCTVAVLDRRDLLFVLKEGPEGWLGIVEMLCARLRTTDQQIAEIALLDLPARLASALLRIATPAADEVSKLQVSMSQRQLGEMVGASRESVNKCLGQWQRAGLLQISGTIVTILNQTGLQRLAAGD